ncbi:MAG TPA: terminase family protein [Stenomitos sp.]
MCQKSRRVGLSWADSADAALEAAQTHGASVWYIGYNKDMAEQYIKDTASWAQSFSLAASAVEEFVFDDGQEEDGILAFRVRFASGHEVVALSSRPKNLRSKKGHIRIDEAAFHENLDELLKAAIAILMWGGSVSIWSTHNGASNAFNQLVERINRGENDYSLHTITLADAIADGLYKRICLINRQTWSIEQEFEWVAQLYRDYGPAAREELDVIPFSGGEGSVFNRQWFNVIDPALVPKSGQFCRHWDIAATAREIAKKTHYYTCGTKMNRSGDRTTILHSLWQQVGPSEVENLIIKTAQADGRTCRVTVELEGGSEAKIWAESFCRKLRSMGYNCSFVAPKGDKVVRAMALAKAAQNNQVDIVQAEFTEIYLDCLQKFDGSPQPKVNDIADSSSGCFNELQSRNAPAPVRQPQGRDLSQLRVF